ncbi:MGMT family protein [Alteromonas sp. KUL49]|uniref:MGMT family protein n=1 Tax=Alteromonas sp. KUL49 TaxID=2480798 RepID=UPI00102EDF8C|nr:MGMT family protein [Alteromonas sp. KUL49]TAP42099.1 cysteine methyltransferase [Alteromonas sp. KUL49]GEA09681.1 methylated-DNA--protein-cysteine methyltransferase [Alteromonas sp. KUL49]
MSEVSLSEKITTTLALVPSGVVVSYGQLADLAGLPGRARYVGQCLKQTNDIVNWHRVLRSNGHIAFPENTLNYRIQCEKLCSEGVDVVNGRVNMKRFGWRPDIYTLLSQLKY